MSCFGNESMYLLEFPSRVCGVSKGKMFYVKVDVTFKILYLIKQHTPDHTYCKFIDGGDRIEIGLKCGGVVFVTCTKIDELG